jgi:hypothetical protein
MGLHVSRLEQSWPHAVWSAIADALLMQTLSFTLEYLGYSWWWNIGMFVFADNILFAEGRYVSSRSGDMTADLRRKGATASAAYTNTF